MSITEVIPLLTSIGALFAALIALLTLIELSKQRKSSYKPDLSLLQNNYHLRQKKESELNLAIDWTEVGSDNSKLAFGAEVSIVNIGFGAAKNVTTKWSFDDDKIIKEINDIAQKTHQSFYIKKDRNHLSIINKGNSSYSVNESINMEQIKYLLPLTHDNSGRKIMIPLSYTMLVSTYLSLATIDGIAFQKITIPSLMLKLKYFDIGKEKHETIHEISCNLKSMSSDTNADGELLNYSFAVNLIEKS